MSIAPLQLCKTCGTNTEFYQCFCNVPLEGAGANLLPILEALASNPRPSESVAIVTRCELGEHCRCKSYDAAYKADCWNWIGEVKL